MTSDSIPAGDILQAGLPPPNDRMLTTCFLAALLHGIVILGVTFSSSGTKADDSAAAGLEVVLINEPALNAVNNPNARYLSQRTQRGSGNTSNPQRALIPRSSLMSVERPGIASGDGSAARQSGGDAGDDELISSFAPSQNILYFAATSAASEPSQLPLLLEKRPELTMVPNDDGVELRMRGETMHQLWIAADTRESDVAVYLDSWRRKIERVGTMNFPDVARRHKFAATPVIEVTIGADGKLLETVVRRTSGYLEIDEAAMRILRLAAPYEPFSAPLAIKHDEIRIAYEWQFLGGTSQGGGSPGTSVHYSEPSN